MRMTDPYRCVALSSAAFVQQLAVSYIAHGYWFYVSGLIPRKKDPFTTDRKIIDQYGIEISKWARARRKRAGKANVHYLRHGNFFVVAATKGEHNFFQDETDIKDVRRDSIRFDGYSIGYKRGVQGIWHPSVRMHPDIYREVKAYFLDIASTRSGDVIASELFNLPFEPYAPVRTQLICILRAVNEVRGRASLEAVPRSALRLRRIPTTVFTVADASVGTKP